MTRSITSIGQGDRWQTPQHAVEISARPWSGNHSLQRTFVFCIVFALAVAYAGAYLKSGWIPGDDGILATSALRVMNGQLPHRDFVENYTGGLSYINATAFRAFGVNLISMRIAVFCCFIAWVPAVFYLASRFAPPWGAAAATLLAVAWSLPTYPTPMPSWYNLFLATFGAAALFRYLDTQQRRWLYIAGLFGGASFLIKVIGLYYVAGVLLFLVFREQALNRSTKSGEVFGSALYRGYLAGSLLLFIAAILRLVHPQKSGRFIHFVIPAVAVTAVILLRERSPSSADSRQRFACLFRMLVPFGLGVLTPVVVFLAPYIASSSTAAFMKGVFGDGMARATSLAVYDPPDAVFLILPIPLLVVLAIGVFSRRRGDMFAGGVVALVGSLLIFASGRHELITQLIFESAEMLAPIAVVIGAVQLVWGADGVGAIRQQQLMLLLSLAAICGLVQFPFAAPIYFCYYLPLLILAMFASISTQKRANHGFTLGALLAFFLLTAVVRIAPACIYHISFTPEDQLTSLSLPAAGGLRVSSPEDYEDMVEAVQQHSTSRQVLAFPECAEVYFLTELQNPTRNDGGALAQDVYAVIASNQVNVIVINQMPYFSGSKTPEVMAAIERAFPHSSASEKYLIRWK
jgi:Dolichyl-phosphate-mannose-protein mannosyltransferase